MNIEKLKCVFNLCSDKNQLIQHAQISLIFQQMGATVPAHINEIIQLIDIQHSETLNFTQFTRLYYISINEQDPVSILFYAADKDYKGQIQPQQLADFLTSLGYTAPGGEALKFASLFASDGVIDRQGFRNAMEWLVE